MRYTALAAVFLVLILVIYAACKKAPTFEEQLASLPPGERQGLESLVTAAGFKLTDLRPVGLMGLAHNPRSVVIDGGHVVGLRLSGAPLAKLDGLAGLSSLGELWLTEASLQELGGLEKATALATLVLDDNRLHSLAGVAGCTGLRTLRVAKNQLESLRGVEGLKQLVKLDASRNKLTDVSALAGLPVLRSLELSGNAIAEAAALKDLPALHDVDLSNNPLKEKPPLRAGVEAKLEGSPAGAPPKNWVAELPDAEWSGEEITQKAEGNNVNYTWSGRYGSFPRASIVDLMQPPADREVTLELSVEAGKARGYLEDPSGRGYLYAEATPGSPGKIVGKIIAQTRAKYRLILENVDGKARGVSYRIHR